MKKSTGVVRKIDELGRIVIPSELRRSLGIDVKDPIEIFVEDDAIILKKYSSHMACAITGDVSPKNKIYGKSKIVLSSEAIEMLLQELRESQVNK